MQPRSRMVLAGIVVFAAVLRFATLDVQSYWFDEVITVKLLKDDFFGLLGAIPDSESTPPLYYALAWFWAKAFGTGEVGLRSFSALIGTATVPLAYVIAKRWAKSERIALVAAALIAVNPLLIWYSQEARAYALLVLVGAGTLAMLPKAVDPDSPGSRRALIGWAVLAALAFATHYFALFLVVPEAIWLLRRRGRAAWPALAGVGVVGLALLPLAVHQAAGDRASFIREEPFGERLLAIVKQILVGYDAPGEVAATVIALAVAAVAIWFVRTRAEVDERRAAQVLATLGGLSIVIPIVLAVGADYVLTRNLILAAVPLIVALGVGLGTARAGGAGLAGAAVLAVVSVGMYVGVNVDEKRQRENWRSLPEVLPPKDRDQRLLLISPAYGREAVELYLPRVRRPRGDEVMAINEIDVIGMVAQGDRDDKRPPVIGATPGFGLEKTIRTPTYTLSIYKAATIAPVRTSEVAGLKQGDSVAPLLQEPPKP